MALVVSTLNSGITRASKGKKSSVPIVADIHCKILDALPFGSNFLHSYAVFRKIWPNDILTLLPGMFQIRHCLDFLIFAVLIMLKFLDVLFCKKIYRVGEPAGM